MGRSEAPYFCQVNGQSPPTFEVMSAQAGATAMMSVNFCLAFG
jgi:hypothetical protein